MKLNDCQFCRLVPFFAILHTLNDALGVPTDSDAKQIPGRGWDNALSAACDVIEKQGSAIATRDFPHVVFEDETERETISFAQRDSFDRNPSEDEIAICNDAILENETEVSDADIRETFEVADEYENAIRPGTLLGRC